MAKIVERYGIYWVQLDSAIGRETRKTRPCVVISRDEMHRSGMAVVCPVTTKLHRRWAHRLHVQSQGETIEIMLDQIRAVSVSRSGDKIDAVSAADAENLRQNIIRLYGTT